MKGNTMTDKKKPFLLALPNDIAEMSREEVDAWLAKALPKVHTEVLNDKDSDA
jgi:hypothetical protein